MNPHVSGKTPAYTAQNDHQGLSTDIEIQASELPAQFPTIHHNNPATHGSLQCTTTMPDTALQQYEEPLYTAGHDDWALQNVDTSFFDTLMHMTGNYEDDVTGFSV